MAWRSTDAHLGRAEPDRERLGNLLIETVLDITQDQDTALDGIQPYWHRAKVTAFDVPRIPREWLERERARIGDWWFRQEYGCEFLDTDDQLYATDLVLAAVSRDVAPMGLPSMGGHA
jgi:hypothetical protein